MGSKRNGKTRLLIAGTAVMVVAACGLAVPSGDLPKVEQRWIVTALETTIDIGDLIDRTQAPATQPALHAHASVTSGARVRPDSNGAAAACSHSSVDATIAFEDGQVVVSDGRATLECSLRDLCPSCRAGRQGKPAFVLHQVEDVPLPDRDDLAVKSVSVTGGSVEVSLRHDFDFVLLRPGEVSVEVWSKGDGGTAPEKLSEFSLDRDFVGGTPVSFSRDFGRDPATIVGGLRLVVDVDAPADPDTTVDLDLSDTMQATISVEGLTVSTVGVLVDKELEPDPQPITVDEGAVSEIVDRVSGELAIIITLVNPFPIEVSGAFDLGEAVRLTNQQRSITVPAATGEQPVETRKEVRLTREQLRAFLERGVFSFGGRVTTDDVVRLDTDKEIRVTISVDVSLLTEPEEA